MFGRHARTLMIATVVVAALAPLGGVLVASGETMTPPPNTFGLRLEGFAVEKNAFSTASAVTPRSAYSYAKLYSSLDLDGGRGLDMEARGANDQYAGLGGAVIFSGDVPTDGNNLPGYAQAFFPTFEGFSQVSEKCAANQTEAREAPECRDQPGPYAFAKVVPDQQRPTAVGIGRNEGNDDGRGDARSTSRIEPQADGSVQGFQSNSGSDQGVPGTPITVDSYRAEQIVVATVGRARTEIHCEGQVSVAGQPIENDKQLQQALAPLTVGGDLRVEYEPATDPEIVRLPGGALQASCHGPRFTVYSDAQGGSGTQYTFGSTFAAVGITENSELASSGDDSGGLPAPPSTTTTLPDAVSSPDAPASIGSDATGPAPTTPPVPETTPDTVPVADAASPETATPTLVREGVDTVPIGVLTGVAAGLLPLAVWLLLGVTGSLARGLPGLRLPPFTS